MKIITSIIRKVDGFISIISFFLIILVFCCGNVRYTTFDKKITAQNDSVFQLKGLKSFKFTRIVIEQSDTIPDYCGGYSEDTTAIDYEKITILIDSVHDVKLHAYKFIPPEYDKYHSEYLTIGKNILPIDSLLQGKFQMYLYFTVIHKFKWDNCDFILLEAISRENSLNGDIYANLLIQMQNKQYVNTTLFTKCYSDINVFGDYNGDGVLDYLDWEQRGDTIHLYSLINDRFIKDEQHYIVVEPSEEDKENDNSFGDQWYYYYKVVDEKWFNPLKK